MAKKIKIAVGDQVHYIFGDSAGSALLGTKVTGTVKHVHPEHDGRLIDVAVDTGKEELRLTTPWRNPEDNAGNTWHHVKEEAGDVEEIDEPAQENKPADAKEGDSGKGKGKKPEKK